MYFWVYMPFKVKNNFYYNAIEQQHWTIKYW